MHCEIITVILTIRPLKRILYLNNIYHFYIYIIINPGLKEMRLAAILYLGKTLTNHYRDVHDYHRHQKN